MAINPKLPKKETLVERRQYSQWTIEIHTLENEEYQARGFLNGKERFTVGGETVEWAAACAVKVISELGSLYKN